jgi:hypothetical protein
MQAARIAPDCALLARTRQIPSMRVLPSTQTAFGTAHVLAVAIDATLRWNLTSHRRNNGEKIVKHSFKTAALSFGVAVLFCSAGVGFAQSSNTSSSNTETTTSAPAPAVVYAAPVIAPPPPIVVAAPAMVVPSTTTTEHQASTSSDSSPSGNSSEHTSSSSTSNY